MHLIICSIIFPKHLQLSHRRAALHGIACRRESSALRGLHIPQRRQSPRFSVTLNILAASLTHLFGLFSPAAVSTRILE